MSTLNVTNISDGTNSTSTTNVVKGSAKAWINMNGTGTISIRDSFNVSSITDNGTGNFIVYFDTNFVTDTYVLSMISQNLDYTSSIGQAEYSSRIDYKYTDRHHFTIANSGQTALADPGRIDIIYFGD